MCSSKLGVSMKGDKQWRIIQHSHPFLGGGGGGKDSFSHFLNFFLVTSRNKETKRKTTEYRDRSHEKNYSYPKILMQTEKKLCSK